MALRLPGQGYVSTAPKHALQQSTDTNSRESKNLPDGVQLWALGQITEVDYETSQVKVRPLEGEGKLFPSEIGVGFHPLLNPIEQVINQYGQIREGMVVRIFWRGKLTPNNILVEIIGDENHQILNKNPQNNEIHTTPYKLFSGGVGF